MLPLLTANKITKLPANLNWFVDNVADNLLRREISSFSAREVGCGGPERYQQVFMKRFFALNHSSFELATAVIYCDEYREFFMAKLFNHPDLSIRDLIDVVAYVDKYPMLHDLYFSQLLMHQNELSFDNLVFIESECKIKPYCYFFTQLRFSAALQRRQELLLKMMKKK